MDQIVYRVSRPGEKEIATFNESRAKALGAAGAKVVPDVIDPTKVMKEAVNKLDGLESLCIGNADKTSNTIVYCVVTTGGGIDGMDFRDKGGQITFASFERKDAERKKGMDSRYEIKPQVVVPSQIATKAAEKLTAVQRLCLIGEAAIPAPSISAPAVGPSLVGRRIVEEGTNKVGTIVEPMAGLAPGYVTIEWEGDRQRFRNEPLAYVLSVLDPRNDTQTLVLTMLQAASELQRAATILAAQAVASDIPDEGRAAVLDVETRIGEATDLARQASQMIEIGSYDMGSSPKL